MIGETLQHKLAHDFSGPILFHYMWWMLKQARERKLKTLYFLARDGYLLREIAQLFCQRFHLPIQCKYLYCSRASLRMPTYHLIGDEAYQLLLLGGYRVTLRSLLLRAELDPSQQAAVCADCALGEWDRDQILSRKELEEIGHRLRQSAVYANFIREKSRNAYRVAISYFRQEGLFAQDTVALVDSGWTGSMQRSLRQLLCSQGFQGGMIGFYFGMYAKPKSPEDGTYLTWYFDYKSKPAYKIPFCNNLFECLLSAPHGMTRGYTVQDGIYRPVLLNFSSDVERHHIQGHLEGVLQYVNTRLPAIEFHRFDEMACHKNTQKRIKRYMAHPRKEEVAYYGRFLFCDDITEAYHFPLADASQIRALNGYSIPARIYRHLTAQKSMPAPELFWTYGTIAYAPRWKRLWYRWNVYVWEWMRYALRERATELVDNHHRRI